MLLDGIDVDSEYESLRVKRQGYSSVRTTYADDDETSIHLAYGIVSPTAWRLLYPYLVLDGSLNFRRVN
jgi:hypothetical protein